MTKKLFLFSLLAVFMAMAAPTDLDAQVYGRKKKKKKKEKTTKTDDYFDESGNFAQKLWYGAGGVLNFQSFNSSSLFRIGLSPMVGYKITPWLSAGPRLSILYTGYKGGSVIGIQNSDGSYAIDPATLNRNVERVGTTDIGVGLFARAKFLQNFFAQVEVENYISRDPVIDVNGNQLIFVKDNDTLDFFKENRSQLNTYIGGGYNSSLGLVGYEIAILFNVTQDAADFNPPYQFRVGFTYNF